MTRDEPLVIGLGELLWDVFPDSRRPGGAPANVAFQAQQLGCRGLVASRVGRDDLGVEILRYLLDRGLDVSAVQEDSAHPTGRVTVDVSDAHHPTYVIHKDVAWDFLEADDALLDAARSANAVCFGTLAQRSPVSRAAIHAAIEATGDECLLVYDVNLRQDFWHVDWIVRSLEQADVVKLNLEEANVLAPVLDCPPGDLPAFAAELINRYDLRAVCVTRAEQGCLLVAHGETVDVPGRRVDVVDAVGSGDAFTAALIGSLLENWPLRAAAEFANEIGALVATRRGAMPELANEFRELRGRYGP